MRIEPEPAKVQRSRYRCMKCRTRFAIDMLVGVPIDQYVAQMQSIRCPSCGSRKIGLGEGRTLAEDVETRIDGTKADRVENWKRNGETGSSSEAIVDHMTGVGRGRADAPRDLDDVRRCVLLLGHLPEWRQRMPEMAIHPEWIRLAPRWDEIETAYVVDSPNLDGGSASASAILKDVS